MQVLAHLCKRFFSCYYSFINIITEATTENLLLGSLEVPTTLANLTRDTTTQSTCPSSLPQQTKLRKARGFKMPNNYSGSLCLCSNFHIANPFHCCRAHHPQLQKSV